MKTRRTEIDDVIAGDVLATDLVDAAGHLLLPRGSVLSAATLAGLRRRGIDCVVLAVAPAEAEVGVAARRPLLEQSLRVRFRRAGNGEATALLFRATLEHLLERDA